MDLASKVRNNKHMIFSSFKKWELLRIPYNLILILIIVTGIWSVWSKIPNYKIFLIENTISFLQANILYFLGPFIEIAFRQSLIFSRGSLMIFITRPISAVFTLVAVILLSTAFIKKRTFVEKLESDDA